MQIADCLVRKCKATTNNRGRTSTSNVEKELATKKRRGPAAPLSAKAIRLDGMHDWSIFMEDGKKGRSKNPDCQQIARTHCQKCKLNLYFTAKSNCFRHFHTE